MEMTAVIEGLKALKKNSAVTIHTDSRYVMDGASKWLLGWKKKGWKTADKKPVKNEDLWRALDDEMARHQIRWIWVAGHSGHPENERADAAGPRRHSRAVRSRKIPLLSMYSALETSNAPGCSTLTDFTTPLSTTME